MHLALSPATASSNARLCLRMGFTCLDRIGSMLGWHLDPDPLPEAPIALTFGEFESAVKMLEDVGFPIERTAEEAWPDFHGWRVNYEAVAYRLADRLVVPPAPWSGPRRDLGPGITEPRRPPQRRPASSAGASARVALSPSRESELQPPLPRPRRRRPTRRLAPHEATAHPPAVPALATVARVRFRPRPPAKMGRRKLHFPQLVAPSSM